MICQLMISDFMGQTGRYDETGYELYNDEDLRIGKLFAEDLLTESHTVEPFHRYDLVAFVEWCEKKLNPAMAMQAEEGEQDADDFCLSNV